MRNIRNIIAPLIVFGLAACNLGDYAGTNRDYDPDYGNGPFPTTRSTTDPLGDTFGAAGVEWDLSALTVTRTGDGEIVRLDFENGVVTADGDRLPISGVVEFDLDQNPTTGGRAVTDVVREDRGATGLGVDGWVQLFPVGADSSMAVFDALGHQTGFAKAFFGGHRITIKIAKSLLGEDDGFMNTAAIVGNDRGATDFVPQAGNLELSNAP